MPGKDRSGPTGQGPQTGKGQGKCGQSKGSGKGKGPDFRFERMAAHMELTEEQQASIKALKDNGRSEGMQVKKELARLKNQMEGELLKDGDQSVMERDATGRIRFHADFSQAAALSRADRVATWMTRVSSNRERKQPCAFWIVNPGNVAPTRVQTPAYSNGSMLARPLGAPT